MADRSIEEIMRMSLSERREAFSASGIDEVVIDEQHIKGYGAFSFLWEKSYVKSPERSADGSIENLDAYAWFLTPHLKMTFGLMSIDTYRTIMKLIYRKNEFLVTCYDVVHNTKTTNRMYFATEEMPKLWAIGHKLLQANTQDDYDEWVELLGIQDYTVEMIGTNVAYDLVKVNYYLNPPDGTTENEAYVSINYPLNTDIIIGSEVDINSIKYAGYKFKYWVDTDGDVYLQNLEFFISSGSVSEDTMTINLYAQWEETGEGYPLTLNYGIGDTVYDENNEPISVLRFKSGETIGTVITRANKQYISSSGLLALTSLPLSPSPTVEYNGKSYTPYENKGWYKTPSIGVDASGASILPLNNDSVINATSATTIYQVILPKKFNVAYNSNGGTEFSPIEVDYGGTVPMLKPYKANNAFGGWYTDEALETAFSGTMPPFDLTLYAKWVSG